MNRSIFNREVKNMFNYQRGNNYGIFKLNRSEYQCAFKQRQQRQSYSTGSRWGRLRERAKSYAKALANDILR